MQRDIELEIISLRRINTDLSNLQASALELEFTLSQMNSNLLSNEMDITNYEMKKKEFDDLMHQINITMQEKELDQLRLKHLREMEELRKKHHMERLTKPDTHFVKFKQTLKAKIDMLNMIPQDSSVTIVEKGLKKSKKKVSVKSSQFKSQTQQSGVSNLRNSLDLLGHKTTRESTTMGVEEKLKMCEQQSKIYQ